MQKGSKTQNKLKQTDGRSLQLDLIYNQVGSN